MSRVDSTGPTPGDPSVGELVNQLSEQLSRLVRDELRMAQLEVQQKSKRLKIGAGAFGAAGILAFLGAAALISCAILALALVIPAWAAALIVAAALMVASAILALTGKKKVSEGAPPIPTGTAKSVKQDATVLKEHLGR
jgi:uncharacterized membrane protein YqjE